MIKHSWLNVKELDSLNRLAMAYRLKWPKLIYFVGAVKDSD